MTPTKKKTVFLGKFSQKGGRGGGPTLGKNSQKIPFFFVGSVPNHDDDPGIGASERQMQRDPLDRQQWSGDYCLWL